MATSLWMDEVITWAQAACITVVSRIPAAPAAACRPWTQWEWCRACRRDEQMISNTQLGIPPVVVSQRCWMLHWKWRWFR
jgi:hypothetical protein